MCQEIFCRIFFFFTTSCFFFQRALPFLMNQVNIKLKEAQDGLNQIGIHFPETDSDRLHFLVEVRDVSLGYRKGDLV